MCCSSNLLESSCERKLSKPSPRDDIGEIALDEEENFARWMFLSEDFLLVFLVLLSLRMTLFSIFYS